MILALVRATKNDEGALHSHFRPFLVAKSEVYSAPPLIPYVTWLRDQYFVSTTREEFDAETGRTVIDAMAWLPGPHRESDRRSEKTLLSTIDPWAFLPDRSMTNTDDWYTPPRIVEAARVALGGAIDLDPASHVIANQVVKARRFFTKSQDGLLEPWSGRVFLNPPFSDWQRFGEKVLSEVAAGRITEIVLLGATRTLTARYFEPVLRRTDAMCIISGRNAFWGTKTESTSPTDGHFLLYIGSNVGRFVNAVNGLGATWSNVGQVEAVA